MKKKNEVMMYIAGALVLAGGGTTAIYQTFEGSVETTAKRIHDSLNLPLIKKVQTIKDHVEFTNDVLYEMNKEAYLKVKKSRLEKRIEDGR